MISFPSRGRDKRDLKRNVPPFSGGTHGSFYGGAVECQHRLRRNKRRAESRHPDSQKAHFTG